MGHLERAYKQRPFLFPLFRLGNRFPVPSHVLSRSSLVPVPPSCRVRQRQGANRRQQLHGG